MNIHIKAVGSKTHPVNAIGVALQRFVAASLERSDNTGAVDVPDDVLAALQGVDDANIANIAKALGVSADDLKTAIDAAKKKPPGINIGKVDPATARAMAVSRDILYMANEEHIPTAYRAFAKKLDFNALEKFVAGAKAASKTSVTTNARGIAAMGRGLKGAELEAYYKASGRRPPTKGFGRVRNETNTGFEFVNMTPSQARAAKGGR